jgi:hypothetical protein
MKCDECQQELWRAGNIAPAGAYARVDDKSYRVVILEQEGPLPATFDGHTALYCLATCKCTTQAQHRRQAISFSELDKQATRGK